MDFQKEVIEASVNQLVLVDFWAPWCGPCVILKPIIEEFVAELDQKVHLVTINVHDHVAIGVNQNIMGLPTLRLYRDRTLLEEFAGSMTKSELAQWVKPHLDD